MTTPRQRPADPPTHPAEPTPRQLDLLAQQLWALEPSCPSTRRDVLLAELADICREIDRLNVHAHIDPDDALVREQCRRCHERLRRIARRWPSDHTTHPALAA